MMDATLHQTTLNVDVAIFGGGIAGLWTLARLLKQGYRAVLLESDALGAGQTGLSQGIIHGGIKYALQGFLNKSSQMVADMPSRWQACFEGSGELDFQAVRVLSDAQYLWASDSLGSRLSGFFASKLLKSRCQALSEKEYPDFFKNPNFHGQVYRLQETVIDVFSLMQSFKCQYGDYLLKLDLNTLDIKSDHENITHIKYHADEKKIKIIANDYVLAAGAGNEIFASYFDNTFPSLQRRPLRMSVVRFEGIQPLYAHCIGLNNLPRLTITSYQREDGRWVWYIGGQIAESGVKKTEAEHEADLTAELKTICPWLSFDKLNIKTIWVDRAEPTQPGGKRPEKVFVKRVGNMLVTWPTKLAMAPLLADEVMNNLSLPSMQAFLPEMLEGLPRANVATPFWES